MVHIFIGLFIYLPGYEIWVREIVVKKKNVIKKKAIFL